MPRDRSLVGVCIIWAAAALLTLSVRVETVSAAGVIVDSLGFESPDYPAGPLQSHDDWFIDSSGSTTATVQSAISHSGAQAVRVDRAAVTDARWAVPTTGFPTQRFVIVDWDMLVNQSFSGGFGPFFGVEAWDDTSGLKLAGSLGVDATTGDILYQQAVSGALTDSGVNVVFNNWHHFRLVLDYAMSKYHFFMDGDNLKVSGEGFVDSGISVFSDADISAIAAGGDFNSQNATGTAYFDNFLVRDGLLGDYDIDGDVDAADYSRWRATFGMATVKGNDADGNANEVVDAADYVIWRNNQGANLFGGAGSGSTAGVVPEPASVTLVLIGWAAFVALRRRR